MEDTPVHTGACFNSSSISLCQSGISSSSMSLTEYPWLAKEDPIYKRPQGIGGILTLALKNLGRNKMTSAMRLHKDSFIVEQKILVKEYQNKDWNRQFRIHHLTSGLEHSII
jgi:hypothetical protein